MMSAKFQAISIMRMQNSDLRTNSVDSDEVAHNEPPHLDLQFANSTVFIVTALSVYSTPVVISELKIGHTSSAQIHIFLYFSKTLSYEMFDINSKTCKDMAYQICSFIYCFIQKLLYELQDLCLSYILSSQQISPNMNS